MKDRFVAWRVQGGLGAILRAEVGDVVRVAIGNELACKFLVRTRKPIVCGSNILELSGVTTYRNYGNLSARIWIHDSQDAAMFGISKRELQPLQLFDEQVRSLLARAREVQRQLSA
jgi:hypothetical protein